MSRRYNGYRLAMRERGMTDEDKAKAIYECEQLVQKAFVGNDCSHDISHVYRVRSLALKIAQTIQDIDCFVVEMVALLHDLYDHKYTTASAGDQHEGLTQFLSTARVCSTYAKKIVDATKLVGYTKDSNRVGRDAEIDSTIIREYACVQDADYLDAIGAIGMLRTSAFSGARGRPLLDDGMTEGKDSCIAHVHDKLLKLQNLMRTAEGKRLAEQRHSFMLLVLQQLEVEARDSAV